MQQAPDTEIARVLCEPLTLEEKVDFLDAVNGAVNAGEITPADATAMVAREYELMSLAK